MDDEDDETIEMNEYKFFFMNLVNEFINVNIFFNLFLFLFPNKNLCLNNIKMSGLEKE